jgi:serine/threonine-protein kinase HipA
MTSDPRHAFVWVWLPGEVEPVVAGRLDLDPETGIASLTYGRSYLERADPWPLYLPDLPLRRGPIPPVAGELPGCIADAGPDAWGQRVILNRLSVGAVDTSALNPLVYLLESGSDRIGALDFQASPSEYVPRTPARATLDELAQSAAKVEQGVPLSPELDLALVHGSSVGGARPKALVDGGERRLVAKFSSTTDLYSVVKAEFVAMELARLAGIDAAPVQLAQAAGRDALLVERFDRTPEGGRRAMVSALTILGLDWLGGRYASYALLADQVRARFSRPKETLRELFSRIVFNVLCGNTDDHPRNHAAFWDGTELELTPAYDICPQLRSGGVAEQLMAIGKDGYRASQVSGCVGRASEYLLSEAEARALVDSQIETIRDSWDQVCDRAELSEVDRANLWGAQFLNPYATEGY